MNKLVKPSPFSYVLHKSPFVKTENPVESMAEGDISSQEGPPQEDPPQPATSSGENVAEFLTPDNPYMAMLDVATAGIGGKSLKALSLTKTGKKLLSKIPGLSKLFTKTKIAKNQPIDFGKTRSFKGGVDAGDVKKTEDVAWKGDIHMGKGPKVVDFKLNEMKSIGKNLDEINFDATKLASGDVKFRGVVSGRTVVEVKLPNGQTQLFYKSSGLAGKKGAGAAGTTEGMWQPYGGHADIGGNKGWFIKDKGYENFYDSKSFRDISGNLDRIAVQGGFEKHITKSQSLASKR